MTIVSGSGRNHSFVNSHAFLLSMRGCTKDVALRELSSGCYCIGRIQEFRFCLCLVSTRLTAFHFADVKLAQSGINKSDVR